MFLIGGFLNSLPPLGARATATQPVETHVAEGQWPIPGVSTFADEGHAANGNCANFWTAPTSWRTEEERSGE